MGLPTRLNGKLTPMPSDKTVTCPNCRRKFSIFDVVDKGNTAKRECPYCENEFEVGKEKLEEKSKLY